MTEKTFTSTQMETALCVWEDFLERVNGDSTDSCSSDLRHLRNRNGTSTMRIVSIAAAKVIDQIWAKLQADGYQFDGPFDWEFVPAAVSLINWHALTRADQFGGPAYEPSIDAMLAEIIKILGDSITSPEEVIEVEISLALRRHLRIDVEDCGFESGSERLASWVSEIRAGRSRPEDAARWVAEKYGLDEVVPIPHSQA